MAAGGVLSKKTERCEMISQLIRLDKVIFLFIQTQKWKGTDRGRATVGLGE